MRHHPLPAALLGAVLLLAGTRANLCAEDPVTIACSGSTFVAPLMGSWIEAYLKEHPFIHVEYQANGSGAGLKDLLDHAVLFALTDAPLTDSQLKDQPPMLHLPVVAGPEVLIYNSKGMPADLVLDGGTLAGIYLGTITQWNDPAILTLNPGQTLPAQDIITVHRGDGSGSTWILSSYLCKVSPAWASKVGCGALVRWPNGIGGRGDQGVAQAVGLAEGAIGYVDLALAAEHHLSYAKLVNHDGKVVAASMQGVGEAVRNTVGGIPDDLRMSITDAPGAGAYPLCGMSYVLIPQDLSYLKDQNLAAQTLLFISWCEHAGQALAAPMYIPIGPELQRRVEDRLKTLVFDGKPLLLRDGQYAER